jgi:hypothetical protein
VIRLVKREGVGILRRPGQRALAGLSGRSYSAWQVMVTSPPGGGPLDVSDGSVLGISAAAAARAMWPGQPGGDALAGQHERRCAETPCIPSREEGWTNGRYRDIQPQ